MPKNYEINPIYMDNHLLVVNKPAGMLVQGDKTRDTSLLDYCKQFLKQEYKKPGDVFLGLVHRLDRPTSGIIVFARTSKAASRLSAQIRNRTVSKKYFALVEGNTSPNGDFEDMIDRREKTSFISKDQSAKFAKLQFKNLSNRNGISMLDINLITGRHHQIRVQFAHRGFPVLGDKKYGSKQKFNGDNIALFSYSITVSHPTRNEAMTFQASPDELWQKYTRNERRL
jgi:23S rRNA pseudouridine1911/1915/1917 synthase